MNERSAMCPWPIGPESGSFYGRRIDWSTEPGIQSTPPTAPKAVRIAYLLEGIADEFRALQAAALDDGKEDVLVATECTLELALTWTLEGEGKLKFWVLEIGSGVSRERAQKVTVKMSLTPAVPLLAREADDGGLSTAEVTTWSESERARTVEEVTADDGGRLRLAYMLEHLADEFRKAKAGSANKQAILRYDKVTLELTGAMSVDLDAGAKFWVLDLAAGSSHKRTETITVDMTPTGLGELAAGGLRFFR
jgi:hypothetical protein